MDHSNEDEYDSSRLRLKVSNLQEEWEELLEEWDDCGNIRSIEDDLLRLIIQTHAAIEDLTAHLIRVFVIKEEFHERAFDYLYSDMSQSHREKFLVECGILSNQTQGKISHFRGLRNEVAHGAYMQLDWYRGDVPEKMNTAFEALNLMTEAFTDREFIKEIYQGESAI